MTEKVLSPEDQDHLAIRIKHRGACPYEKGHSDKEFGDGFCLGLTACLVVGIIVAMIALSGHH